MIGYIFIIIFLVTSGLFHWVVNYETNLLQGTEVDLIPFFNLSPTIFLILIPAITMRSFAEERKNGTIELLFTRPITDLKIVLAKYLAGVTLLVIAILPTVVYYLSMRSLGMNTLADDGSTVSIIDEGATFTSYIGLLLIGATFVAIGIFSSSLTSSQIVAFIIAMFLCWAFFSGLPLLGSFSQMGSFDAVFQAIGMTQHYDSIMRGVIDSTDIIYFFGLIVIFIAASLTVIKSLKR